MKLSKTLCLCCLLLLHIPFLASAFKVADSSRYRELMYSFEHDLNVPPKIHELTGLYKAYCAGEPQYLKWGYKVPMNPFFFGGINKKTSEFHFRAQSYETNLHDGRVHISNLSLGMGFLLFARDAGNPEMLTSCDANECKRVGNNPEEDKPDDFRQILRQKKDGSVLVLIYLNGVKAAVCQYKDRLSDSLLEALVLLAEGWGVDGVRKDWPKILDYFTEEEIEEVKKRLTQCTKEYRPVCNKE